MRIVIQRVSEARVKIDGKLHAEISRGLLLLAGIEPADRAEDLEWAAAKICNMRIFDDSEGVMNLSVKETGGAILLVSNFTLQASTKKGNRPSYINAARPETAAPLCENFGSLLEKEIGKEIQQGVFGADMKVGLVNDGPVTIVLDTKNRI
jgi:D-tyrosyl-tRNA(Tyr) deacylase